MVKFAEWDMRRELSRIWQVCFSESPRFPDYFLNNCFKPENCLVQISGSCVESCVYMLPAYIASDGECFKAHYIFAAGTLPEMRGRGYMSELLGAAADAGARRGEKYSAVLPSEQNLYGFYKKSGYKSFFKVRTLSISRDKMEQTAVYRSGRQFKVILDSQRLNSLRRICLSPNRGSLLWSDGMFGFCTGMGKIYGEKLISVKAGDNIAYAVCSSADNGDCLISEAMADNTNAAGLLWAAVLNDMPAENYLLRLSADSILFPGKGDISYFGMIKPLGSTGLAALKPNRPYLGLGLD